MTETISATLPARRPAPSLPSASGATGYPVDAWQRSVLFLDTLRRRSDRYREHMAEDVPHVLSCDHELVLDGRTLQRPVNIGLVRIVPPEGVANDEERPFVVVDPRAGHCPGIGGFKADSAIDVAVKAGHACYFVGFLPEPVPVAEPHVWERSRVRHVCTGRTHPAVPAIGRDGRDVTQGTLRVIECSRMMHLERQSMHSPPVSFRPHQQDPHVRHVPATPRLVFIPRAFGSAIAPKAVRPCSFSAETTGAGA